MKCYMRRSESSKHHDVHKDDIVEGFAGSIRAFPEQYQSLFYRYADVGAQSVQLSYRVVRLTVVLLPLDCFARLALRQLKTRWSCVIVVGSVRAAVT